VSGSGRWPLYPSAAHVIHLEAEHSYWTHDPNFRTLICVRISTQGCISELWCQDWHTFQLKLLSRVKIDRFIHTLSHLIWIIIRPCPRSRLQIVQNAATRFLTGVRKREHNTPILMLACYRVELNGLASSYLSEWPGDLVVESKPRSCWT